MVTSSAPTPAFTPSPSSTGAPHAPVPPARPAPPQALDDPWTSAEGATWDSTFSVFGLVQADVWYAALVKGIGKVPFDPLQHRPDQRVTAVTIAVVPVVPEQQPTQRDMIAESSEWTKLVNPSIKALGTTLRGLHDRHAEAQLVPTGRTYTNAAGEVRAATTFKFVRLFGSEDACRVAAEESRRRRAGGPGPAAAPGDGSDAGPGTSGTSGTSRRPDAPAPLEISRQVAAKFLAGLWSASGKDLVRFGELLRTNAATAQHFDLDSPEVAAVISEGPPA